MKQELLELVRIVKNIVDYLHENVEDEFDLETIENIKQKIRKLEERLQQLEE